MNRDDVAMTTVQVWGHDFEVPKVLVNEILQLRRLDLARQLAHDQAMREAYEAEHGPLPEPTGPPLWRPA